jgi:hypothetical protein
VKRVLKAIAAPFVGKFGKSSYYKRDYQMRTALQKYERLEPYLVLYKESAVKQQVKTDIEIKFSKNLAFGDTLKNAKLELSSLDYDVLGKNNLGIEILAYKRIVGGIKVKCQLHFFRNKLFMFNYSFNNPTKEKANEIIKILNHKYLKSGDYASFPVITDAHNNCIMVKNTAVFELNYLAHDSDFFNNALSLCIARVEDENTKEISFFQNMAEFV